MSVPISLETQEAAKALYIAGNTRKIIADRLNVGVHAVAGWIKRGGWQELRNDSHAVKAARNEIKPNGDTSSQDNSSQVRWGQDGSGQVEMGVDTPRVTSLSVPPIIPQMVLPAYGHGEIIQKSKYLRSALAHELVLQVDLLVKNPPLSIGELTNSKNCQGRAAVVKTLVEIGDTLCGWSLENKSSEALVFLGRVGMLMGDEAQPRQLPPAITADSIKDLDDDKLRELALAAVNLLEDREAPVEPESAETSNKEPQEQPLVVP